MRALVVYESMFGNTHEVADRVADGLRTTHLVTVVPACAADAAVVQDYELVVVGAPTHAHGLPRPTTRRSAEDIAGKEADLDLEVDVSAPGVREWLGALRRAGRPAQCAAAFDTRVDGPPVLVGRASRGIAKRLGDHGFQVVADPESFLVDRHNHLVDGEADRAVGWGRMLARRTRQLSATR